jgi:hypothetical protein
MSFQKHQCAFEPGERQVVYNLAGPSQAANRRPEGSQLRIWSGAPDRAKAGVFAMTLDVSLRRLSAKLFTTWPDRR